MKEFLENFRLEKYRFVLTPHEVLKLSSYPGSSLRRDFIPVFKQITCIEPHGECSNCTQQDDCVFYLTMENKIRNFDNEYLKRFQTPPKPFIFEPPLARKSFYTKNEDLIVDLLLIGKAVKYFPHFFAAFRRLGDQGMGRNRGKFFIHKVFRIDLLKNDVLEELVLNPQLSSGEEGSFFLADLYEHFRVKEENQISQVQVSFLTPLRMKRAGSETWHLSFRILMRNLLTRISNLGYSYCDYPDFYHFSDLIYEAGAVKTLQEDLTWEDWRDPRRNKVGGGVSKFGGYRGNIVYQGNLTDFWPWLKLAEILHLGKNCSFGLGRVAVEAKS